MTALITLAEHLEQQLGAGLRERHISQLVDNQELISSELPLQAKYPLFVASLQVMSEQKLGRIGHDSVPVSRPRYVLADVIATWARGRYG